MRISAYFSHVYRALIDSAPPKAVPANLQVHRHFRCFAPMRHFVAIITHV
jgi:hypothetical protein